MPSVCTTVWELALLHVIHEQSGWTLGRALWCGADNFYGNFSGLFQKLKRLGFLQILDHLLFFPVKGRASAKTQMSATFLYTVYMDYSVTVCIEPKVSSLTKGKKYVAVHILSVAHEYAQIIKDFPRVAI